MLTLTSFLQDLIVSGTIVYISYCCMRIAAYCVLWLIGMLSFKQGDGPHRFAERTVSQVGKEGVGLAQASPFPILKEANHLTPDPTLHMWNRGPNADRERPSGD